MTPDERNLLSQFLSDLNKTWAWPRTPRPPR